MALLQRWRQSWRAVLIRGTIRGVIAEAWQGTRLLIAQMCVLGIVFWGINYLLRPLVVLYPMYTNLSWGLFGLISLFVYLPLAYRAFAAPSERKPLSYYFKAMLLYFLAASGIWLLIGGIFLFVYSLLMSSSALYTQMYVGSIASVIFVGVLNLVLPAVLYDGCSVDVAFKRAWRMWWGEFPFLLMTLIWFHIVVYIPQVVCGMMLRGGVSIVYLRLTQDLAVFISSIWGLFAAALYIVIYRRRKHVYVESALADDVPPHFDEDGGVKDDAENV